jgi:hypothetical protein
VNNLFETVQSMEIKQILDIRKREFVKYSKQFSNTLKAFFRQGQYVSFKYTNQNIFRLFHFGLIFL